MEEESVFLDPQGYKQSSFFLTHNSQHKIPRFVDLAFYDKPHDFQTCYRQISISKSYSGFTFQEKWSPPSPTLPAGGNEEGNREENGLYFPPSAQGGERKNLSPLIH